MSAELLTVAAAIVLAIVAYRIGYVRGQRWRCVHHRLPYFTLHGDD